MKDSRYFTVLPFERNGRVYEALGVRFFKRFASAGDLVNRRRRRFDSQFRNVRNHDSALEWEARTRFNELAHLLSLAFSVVMIGWLCFRERYTWLPVIALLNLVLNVYPILLQRYNRARIHRIRSSRSGGCPEVRSHWARTNRE
jgi:hypothetical protein